MQYTAFRIKSFKGIEDLTVALHSSPTSSIVTLVGLNESGKTTILEAINFFWRNRASLKELGLQGYDISDPHTIIPKHVKGNYSGNSGVQAEVLLDATDINRLIGFLAKYNLKFKNVPHTAKKSIWIKFADSRPQQESSRWNYDWIVVDPQGRETPLTEHSSVAPACNEVLEEMLPAILYFPNFLFDFPDRIYLDNPPEDRAKHDFYKAMIQDVLDSLDSGLRVDTHIVDRAKSNKNGDRQALEAVLLQIASSISKHTFENWDRFLRRSKKKKEVRVSFGVEGDSVYLELRILEGSQAFELSERSMGFRWFFSYLLFTYYRGFRQKESPQVLFLFDEPASNLHSSAQMQLRDSFEKLPKGCSVMYSTHSQHMINPAWLENTYIVRNQGVDYENLDGEPGEASVSLVRYRAFVSENPTELTYFQPILDVLDYKPSNLELGQPTCFVEGKNDYYVIQYLKGCLGAADSDPRIAPACGASGLDPLITLGLGWGYDFIILLDDDSEGHTQKRKYLNRFGSVLRNRVFTVNELDPAFSKKEVEDLCPQSVEIKIDQVFGSDPRRSKVQKRRCLQELLMNADFVSLSDSESAEARTLLNAIQARLGALAEQVKEEPLSFLDH